ncbi:MAG: response regulator [Ktedonobacteraceae bacterium]|nr:response regulator [Ktedonobacteraceae bacterium]
MGKRILVIEPSRTIRAIFALNLPQGGHHVLIFKDYEAALAAYPRFHEQPPDIAFVALHADRPESAQALMRLRVMCPQAMLVMMLTQEDSKKLVVQRIGGGVLAVPLLKPFRIREVLALVAAPADPLALLGQEQEK